ncbi:hypothetical protein NQZ68_002671 [Dissostichus eleginoides]|nr:hypothetical protein NQZ68_002671 [Dissostichus eleginoides]
MPTPPLLNTTTHLSSFNPFPPPPPSPPSKAPPLGAGEPVGTIKGWLIWSNLSSLLGVVRKNRRQREREREWCAREREAE